MGRNKYSLIGGLFSDLEQLLGIQSQNGAAV